jgi:uncharacterized membrane protein YphA (DoxX/SURF4 family)
MKDTIITPFVEGFVGGICLAIGLFTAVWKAVATVTMDFVNNGPRGFSGRRPTLR